MRKPIKIILTIFIVFLMFFVALVAFLIIKANSWSKDFQSEINPAYMVNEASTLDEALDKKIQEYILSEDEVESVIFTPNEVAKIVYGSLQDMSSEAVNVSTVYIKPDEDIWKVCGLTRLEKFDGLNGWVCADITKDDMQTAQLYVTTVSIQGISIDRVFPSILTKINQGIAEALVTANENGFVGRTFENIELQEDQLVVKGTLY
jgi:hypothetical protein